MPPIIPAMGKAEEDKAPNPEVNLLKKPEALLPFLDKFDTASAVFETVSVTSAAAEAALDAFFAKEVKALTEPVIFSATLPKIEKPPVSTPVNKVNCVTVCPTSVFNSSKAFIAKSKNPLTKSLLITLFENS